MTTLVFVSKVQAFEGNLLTAHLFARRNIIFFDVSEEKFLTKNVSPMPAFLKGNRFSRMHVIRMRYFQDFCAKNDIQNIYSIGLDAADYAWRVFDEYQVTPILLRGDLDFSTRRRHLVAQFQQIVANSRHLLLEDQLEMNKATSLGSNVPHLKIPMYKTASQRVLKTSGEEKVAIVLNRNANKKTQDQAIYFAESLKAAGFSSKTVFDDFLYGNTDLGMHRHLAGTIRYRIGDCTRVVFLGSSRNYSVLIPQLLEQADRVFVDDLLGNGNTINHSPNVYKGRGRALLERLISVINGDTSDVSPLEHISSDPSEHVEKLARKAAETYPAYYEEFTAVDGLEFDLFFTVAPIEDRANGARPQRIRNMYETLSNRTEALVITSNDRVLKRKIAYLEWLFKKNLHARLFYGENSTSPLGSYQTLDLFEELLAKVDSQNSKILMFIRDLHWLDDSIEINISPSNMESMVSRGLRELDIASKYSTNLLAPDNASIEGFNRLLSQKDVSIDNWMSMPPGTSSSNQVNFNEFNEGLVGTTFVYAGGASSVYGMSEYLNALARTLGSDTEKSIFADFIVREDEVDFLRSELSVYDLDLHSHVRILHSDFEDYVPRTRAVGVILLSSDYARLSFPYKTMSMIEKHMPIITFEDMAISNFVTSNNVGLSCTRDADSIEKALNHMSLSDFGGYALQDLADRNSWDQRLRDVV